MTSSRTEGTGAVTGKQSPAPEGSADDLALAPKDLEALAETQPLLAAERIMAHLRSPAGCPWDREQTFDSIRRHTLEEVYEVFDAIERRAWPELQDELGDLLLQVLFYAQMASEAGRFTLADVARSLDRKLIRRHPHIFADTSVADSAEVKRNWDEIKRAEKGNEGAAAKSLLADVSRSMPAMSEARKLGSAAAKVGFDWQDACGVLAKVHEELRELEAEMAAGSSAEQGQAGGAAHQAAVEAEFGDVLFTMVSLGRHLGLDGEMALRQANAKFRARFEIMEAAAVSRGEALEQLRPSELEELWGEAKRLPPAEVPA